MQKKRNKRTGTARNEKQKILLSRFIIPLFVVIFVLFLFYLDDLHPNNKIPSEQTLSREPKHEEQRDEYFFTFHDILPARRVESTIAEDELSDFFKLQAGAFKELRKADAMKANLALIGVESTLLIDQNNGTKIYKIQVGPFSDRKKIEKIQALLKLNKINAFIKKP